MSGVVDAAAAALAEKLRGDATELYKRGDYAGATAKYSAAIHAAPSSVLYSNRAAANMMLQAYDEAAEDCRRAISLDPANAKAYVRGAKAELALGNLEEAQALAQQGLLRDPRDESARGERQAALLANTRLTKAQAALASREFDRSLSLFNTLLDTSPASYVFKLLRIESMLGARKYDDAGAACQELMRANSSDTKLLVLRARVLAAQGNSGSAIKHLSEALRVDPDCAPAARLLKLLRKADTLKTAGNDAFKGGRWQAAVDAYAECLALDPTDENSAFASKLYCNRAAAWLKLGQHEQALADATRSVELDDKYVKGYQRRAAAAQALGDKESVEAALRDLHKASDLAETAGDHATVEELRGSIRDAKAALKKARRKDYYKILDVAKDADDDELKKAYRKVALRCHPDKTGHMEEAERKRAEATFKDATEAYEILTDATKRRQFDAGASFDGAGDVEHDHESPFSGGGGCGGGGMRGFGGMGGGGMEEILFQMLSQQGGMGGMGGGGMPFGFPGGGGGGFRRR